jgi:hypothetical protein
VLAQDHRHEDIEISEEAIREWLDAKASELIEAIEERLKES